MAALLVLLEHWRNALFVDFLQIPTHRLWFALPYLLSSAGHQAVVIFFLLSGYLITGSILRMLVRGNWSWATYLTHRLVRLWVVLIPGLMLCALWDTLGIHLHLAPALYGGALYNHMTIEVSQTLTIRTFFLNVFFLQGIKGPLFGSDGALWSLANEFWYYILFPLGLLALYRPAKPVARPLLRVAYGLLFLFVAWFVEKAVLLSFPIWLAGSLLCIIPAPRLTSRSRLLASAAYIPAVFLLAKQTLVPGLISDYILTVLTFGLLWVLLSATHPMQPSPGERFSRELARFSYTLYVVHMPFIILLAALTVGNGRWVPNLPHILEALAILALSIGYAYGVAVLTEFRTDTFRRWIEARLGLDPRQDKSTAVTRT